MRRMLVFVVCGAAGGVACSSSSTSGPGGGGSSSSGGSQSGGSSGSDGTSSGNTSGTSSSGTSSSSSGSLDDDAPADLDTLKGTVSASGVTATFTGAMEMNDLTTVKSTAYYATPDFGTTGVLDVNFTGPPGSKFVSLSLSLGETAGAPAKTVLSCSTGTHPANLYFSWTTSDGEAHSVEASPGLAGASCSVTFGKPVFVTANSEGDWYFAHGMLSGSLVSAPMDGSVETGSITATW
jgi:hypothetical protein